MDILRPRKKWSYFITRPIGVRYKFISNSLRKFYFLSFSYSSYWEENIPSGGGEKNLNRHILSFLAPVLFGQMTSPGNPSFFLPLSLTSLSCPVSLAVCSPSLSCLHKLSFFISFSNSYLFTHSLRLRPVFTSPTKSLTNLPANVIFSLLYALTGLCSLGSIIF